MHFNNVLSRNSYTLSYTYYKIHTSLIVESFALYTLYISKFYLSLSLIYLYILIDVGSCSKNINWSTFPPYMRARRWTADLVGASAIIPRLAGSGRQRPRRAKSLPLLEYPQKDRRARKVPHPRRQLCYLIQRAR